MPKLGMTLPKEGIGSVGWWTSQLEQATRVRKARMPEWQKNLDRYLGKKTRSPDEVQVNRDYEKTEQKKAGLYFQNPAVKLRPKPGHQPPSDLATRVFARVLNDKIGPDQLDLEAELSQVLFDVICPAGIGAVHVGYETITQGTVQVQTGEQPDPTWQPQGVLGINEQPPMVPVLEEMPNIVSERYFVDYISPSKLLKPPGFSGANHDKAPWIGYDFYMNTAEAIRRGWITPDEAKDAEDDQRLIDIGERGAMRQGQIHGRVLWYYAAKVDPMEGSPERIRKLVLIDGQPTPVVHENSPDQHFDEHGRFVMGVEGFPVKVLTLRYVSDEPYPPSDCSASRALVDELSMGRTQMIRQRERSGPKLAVNTSAMVDQDQVEKVKQGKIGDIIALNQDPDTIFKEIARAQWPRENFTFNDYLDNDINRTWAMPDSASGALADANRTATEHSYAREATQSRFSKEQNQMLRFFLSIVRTLAALIQLYHDDQDYVQIIGPDGVEALHSWDKDTIAGKYLFEVIADTQKRPDTSADQQLALTRYNLLANDPYVNRETLVRDTLEKFGVTDPDRFIVQPDPEAGQEKPRVSLAIKGDDLNPMMPQYPNIVSVLQAAGIGVNTPNSAETGPSQSVDKDILGVTTPDGRIGGAA